MNTADSNVTVMNILQIIECFSQSSATFEIRFCLFRTWTFTRFTNDLVSPDNSNSVSSFPLTKFWGSSLRIDFGSHQSVTRHYLIHNGLRGSIMMGFLVRRTKWSFSSRCPRSFIGSPRSLVQFNLNFPLLKRPNTVIIPLCTACWGEAFHELHMMSIVGSFHQVYVPIKSLWSLLFLSNSTPRILISITSLPRAYWTQGWYVRRHPCNKAHHWSRFCCDTFFSWFLLSSFCHCSSASCGTEMANVKQIQQMNPLITREIPFG